MHLSVPGTPFLPAQILPTTASSGQRALPMRVYHPLPGRHLAPYVLLPQLGLPRPTLGHLSCLRPIRQ